MLNPVRAVCALALAGLLVAPANGAPRPEHAAPAAPPRNAFGRPDLGGMWSANFVMDMEASDDAPTLVVSEARARELLKVRIKAMTDFSLHFLCAEVPDLLQGVDGLPLVRGERRTRLVTLPTDGRLPYTPAGRAELKRGPAPRSFDNPEDRPDTERCLLGGSAPPFVFITFSNQLQIVQTRDYVLLHGEYGDDMRLIPFADHHRPAMFKSPLGDSIARWEGKTLVIETVGISDKSRYRFFPSLIVSGDSTVVERLTRVSSRELLYQFTVIDPKVYAAPWSAEFSWYATDKPMYEHACHEGNYSLPGILGGARHDEAVKAAKVADAR